MQTLLLRLENFRALDPGCGSGNFLYLSLHALRIGDIQRSHRNGYPHAINPILKPLKGIEQGDALLNADGSEAQWPEADAIIGNSPFLGDKMMRGELGDEYVNALRKTYEGRVSGGADLVTYWFEKALYRLYP